MSVPFELLTLFQSNEFIFLPLDKLLKFLLILPFLVLELIEQFNTVTGLLLDEFFGDLGLIEEPDWLDFPG